MSPETRNWLIAWKLAGSPSVISFATAMAIPSVEAFACSQYTFLVLGGTGAHTFYTYAGPDASLSRQFIVDADYYATLEAAREALWRILAPAKAKPYEVEV